MNIIELLSKSKDAESELMMINNRLSDNIHKKTFSQFFLLNFLEDISFITNKNVHKLVVATPLHNSQNIYYEIETI